MEAKVMMAKCEKTKESFGMRIQKDTANTWLLTWAFEIAEELASKEGFDSESNIVGNFVTTGEYPGCPSCGAKDFFTCGACGKITCWGGNSFTTCAWCGNSSEITFVDQLTVKGGGF